MSTDKSNILTNIDNNDLKEFAEIVKDKFNPNNTSSIKSTLMNKYSEYKTIKSTNESLKQKSLRVEQIGWAGLTTYLLFKGPIQKKMTLSVQKALIIPAALFIPAHFVIQSYINSNYRYKIKSLVSGENSNSNLSTYEKVKEKAKDMTKH